MCATMVAGARKGVDVREEYAMRVRLLGWALVLLGWAVASLVLFVVAVTGISLVLVWVGLPLLAQSIVLLRRLAEAQRRFAGELLGEPIGSPYLDPVTGNLFVRLLAVLRDPATRRDAVWLAVNSTAGLALTIGALVEGVLDLVFWWLPKGQLLRINAHLSRVLLAPTEKTRLAQRVQELTESRAETVDTSAAELRRIERDLHDGAQARLVSLGMSLGLAEEQFDSNPEAVRALLAEARTSSSDALAELRDLVRGIHPPVLADRGLVGAVQALALSSPLSFDVHAQIPERLPAPVESAAYFAVAEAMTNVIKHSSARRASVRLVRSGEVLELTVRDDGIGGATPERGTGLRGIQRRLSAFDGSLELTSPHGGPTTLAMVLPCASSSPKISPSSGTA
jgi:signal transduction histidine kinase